MLSLAIALFLGLLLGFALWLKNPYLVVVGISTLAFVYSLGRLYEALMNIYEMLSPS